MDFLRLLEKIRTPFLDLFFSLVTRIGEETLFLVIAIFIFWCIDKRMGYYVLITGLVGTVANQILKLACRIPRPWEKAADFTIVESARSAAEGYSFPSGHTQNVAGTFGCIANWSKRIPVRIISLAIIALVAFSRMYLGVHTPADVCFSLGLAVLLVVFLYPIFKSDKSFKCAMPFVIAGSLILSLGFLIFAFAASEDAFTAVNLASARKNSATLLGCTLALIPVYTLDVKLIDFETHARWYSQVIKLVLGFCGVLLIKEGIQFIFGEGYAVRVVAYFLAVLFAGCIWPLTFKFFSKLRIPLLDRIFVNKAKTE